MGLCYFRFFTRAGVVWGLVAGLVAVTLTDRTVAEILPAIMGFIQLFLPERIASSVGDAPWGAYPLTIHSAGWGIFFNLLVAVLVSYLWPETGADREKKAKHHRFVQAVSGISEDRRRHVPLAWLLTVSGFSWVSDPLPWWEIRCSAIPTSPRRGARSACLRCGYGSC